MYRIEMPHLNNKFRDSRVCVIGLGYVGLTLATVMAGAGFNVIGIERRQDLLEMLNCGKPHFFEPGLEGRLRKGIQDNRLSFFKEIPAECRATTYIITILDYYLRQVVQKVMDGEFILKSPRILVKYGKLWGL